MVKFFVGSCRSNALREVFKFDGIPNEESHPQYLSALGPFKTRRAAQWVVDHPMCRFDNIAHVERMAKTGALD